MRFDSITGNAFGPFKNDELTLGPGFTIVHGLNESGKSSWAAALYASLAGRRRSRGRGSKEDAQFRARHKPWSGSRWQVTAHITTDDGTQLAVVQNLAQGTTRILDLETSHALTAQELQARFGIQPSTGEDIDVGQLFGLSRGTLRATTFVPQAEVLRVVEQADELQQFLQRAAANQAVDVTAHQVIDTLRDELSTRVGSPSVGQRPLRAASQHLEVAQERAYTLRAARDELRQVASQLRRHTDTADRARSELAELRTLQGWKELDDLETRIGKVHVFDLELERLESVPQPSPAELRERVHAARTAYLTLGELPAAPDGPGVADLEQQLAELPEVPSGDTAPDPQVRTLWEQLTRSVSALVSHDGVQDSVDEIDLPDVGSEDVRRLADRLDQARPTWDPAEDDSETSLRAEHDAATQRFAVELEAWTSASAAHERAMADYEQARGAFDEQVRAYEAQAAAHRGSLSAWEASQGSRSSTRADEGRSSRRAGGWQPLLGVLLLLAGAAAFLVEPIAGVVLVVVGVALVVWGLSVRARAGRVTSPPVQTQTERPQPPTPPTPPRPPSVPQPGARPAEPVLSPRVDDIVSRRQQWRAETAAYDSARAELLQDLQARGLPTDPDELRTLARRIDEQEGARRAAEGRRASAEQLRGSVAERARQLREALAGRGEDVGQMTGPDEADEAYRRYEQRCQERAALAKLAGRREDLHAALAARQSEEQAFQSAQERHNTRSAALLTLMRDVGLDGHGDDADAAAIVAASWLEQQARADETLARRARLTSLRDQLLDGTALEDLTAQAHRLQSRLGSRPEGPSPTDLDEAVAAADREAQAADTQRASTAGRLQLLRDEEQDLAAAIEEAARREADLGAVQELRATMELAIEHLEAAQTEAHRSLAPVLESAMRRRIPLVTNGRYRDVRVQPEDLAVELQERTGAWRNAAYLSQGTTEQTYLLLRLALVEHLDTRETMPLVLDDVTVQCDRTRTIALLELLSEISRERQVIVFSQESGVLEWAQDNLDEASGDRLVTLTTT